MKRKINAKGPRIVHNRLLGGWYVVIGPHQTPLNGRFNSRAEAQAWLQRKNPQAKNPISKRTKASLKRSMAAVALRRKGEALIKKAQRIGSRKMFEQGMQMVKRANASGVPVLGGTHTEGPVGRLPNARSQKNQRSEARGQRSGKAKAKRQNSGMFGPEAVASARRVTKVRLVVEKNTGQIGEILGKEPGGYLKVKWRNRDKPSLIKRSEIRRANPGLMEIAGGLQALDYLSSKLKKKNPAKTASRKRNPTTRAMSQRFQGQVTGGTKRYYVSDHIPHADFSRAGKLVFLKLDNHTKQLRIPGAIVAIDPTTERLIVGGTRAPMFNRKAKSKGEGLDYGALSEICYLTAKRHIGNGKTFEYHHKFGEEGGAPPHLIIDHEGMPIIRGGSYKIGRAGIID